MNAGKLTSRIDILTIGNTDTVYSWMVSATVWVKAERENRLNVYSTVGRAAPQSVKFTLRRCALTQHNAIRWAGQHCFITNIVETPDRRYLEVMAALVETVTCTATVTTTTSDELKRVVKSTTLITFPGVLTEKYLGRVQDEPMAVNKITYVLITPKAITVDSGALVTAGGHSYAVLLAHTLDAHKNEYELTRREEP